MVNNILFLVIILEIVMHQATENQHFPIEKSDMRIVDRLDIYWQVANKAETLATLALQNPPI